MSRSQFSRLSLCAAAIGALAITAFAVAPSRAAEDAVIIPAPAADTQASDGIQTAVIAGGCFWGVQGVFQHAAGVVNAVSGYAGGSKSTADYNMVSTGSTGHAESVEVKYDPKKISYGKILQIFFSVAHDPTQLNRQGPDSGTQYRILHRRQFLAPLGLALLDLAGHRLGVGHGNSSLDLDQLVTFALLTSVGFSM